MASNKKTSLELWMRFAKRVENLALAILQESKVSSPKGAVDPRVIALLLLIRTVNNYKGVRTLLIKKMIVEARILARNCMENFLWVGALVGNPDSFVKKMQDSDRRHKQLQGKRLLELVSEDQKINLVNLRKHLKDLSKEWPDVQTITPSSVAKDGDLYQGYLFYSELSMDSAHPTTKALSRYLVRYEFYGTTKHGYTFNPPAKKKGEATETIWYAAWTLMGVCIGVSELIQLSPKIIKRMKKIDEDYHLLSTNSPPN